MIHFVTFCFDETESCCAKYSVKKPNALYASGLPLAGLNTPNMQTNRIQPKLPFKKYRNIFSALCLKRHGGCFSVTGWVLVSRLFERIIVHD